MIRLVLLIKVVMNGVEIIVGLIFIWCSIIGMIDDISVFYSIIVRIVSIIIKLILGLIFSV